MTIIPSIEDLEVTIAVDGQTAREYDDPDDGNENSTCPMARDDFHLPPDHQGRLPYQVKYIESKPGKHFAIKIRKGRRFRNLGGYYIACGVYVDGRRELFTYEEGLATQDGVWDRKLSGFASRTASGGWRMYNFQFSELKTVDATSSLSSSELKTQTELAKHCGTIKVEFFHMKHCPVIGHTNDVYTPRDSISEVSEKALKGRAVDCTTSLVPGSHCGEPLPRRIPNYADAKKRPFAVFEFRYRTKEGLRRECIIPPPTVADEVNEMSEAEVRQRLAQVLQENRRIAVESDGFDIKREPRIKDEVVVDEAGLMAKYRARRLDDGRLEVDLTGVKREAEVDEDRFMATYKARKLENGRLEIDLTED